jgi:hypothetical protein
VELVLLDELREQDPPHDALVDHVDKQDKLSLLYLKCHSIFAASFLSFLTCQNENFKT